MNQLTTEEIIKLNIDEFNTSKARQLMLKGESYYKAENDILERKMYRFENEQKVEDITKANNKLSHAFMHLLVDDKVNYLLRKPYTLECEDEKYLKNVTTLLGDRFQKKLSRLGTETSNKGISYLYPYIDKLGNFKTMMLPSEQVIPLWLDNDQETLQGFIRYYDVETYEGRTKKVVTKIEYFTELGVEYYVLSGEKVILDAERYLNTKADGILQPHFYLNEKPKSWNKVPLIAFKNNDYELPDIQFVKSLIDNYDLTRSDISNDLEEIKNIIYGLRGYGGESLSEFMKELAYYKAVKLDEDGGIDPIETKMNIEAAKTHYEELKKDIYDLGQGVNKASDKLGNSPSGVALKFMYSGLDLKCNALEDNFKFGFEELLYFVNMYLELSNESISDKKINIVFNRDIAINESQAITDCQNSKGVISDRRIVANHPWVTDLDNELKQIDKELSANEVELLGEGEE